MLFDRVPYECVSEREVVVAMLDEQTAVDQRAQLADELALSRVQHRRHQIERRRRTEDGHRLDQPAVRHGEPVELPPHHLFERPGQWLLGEFGGLGIAATVGELFEEERITAGALVHRVG